MWLSCLPQGWRAIATIGNPMSRVGHVIAIHPWKIAFARVPKVATTSVRHLLARHLALTSQEYRPSNDAFWINADQRVATLVSPRRFAREMPDYWCFTIVRDPLSRIVSCYNNKIIRNSTLSKRFAAMGCYSGMPLPAFIERVCATPDSEIDIHLVSQFAILRRGFRLYPDYVGRIETLDADWSVIRAEIHARTGADLGPLPQKNVTREASAARLDDVKDSRLRRMVFERYWKDYRYFYPERIPFLDRCAIAMRRGLALRWPKFPVAAKSSHHPRANAGRP
jgi:hypothetical protein